MGKAWFHLIGYKLTQYTWGHATEKQYSIQPSQYIYDNFACDVVQKTEESHTHKTHFFDTLIQNGMWMKLWDHALKN
jgi:hypothetical protein